ncbi:hypothetical protein BSU01_02015 [Erwinia billingiae]|nr:hypothetical protein [Erwinia billingiae]
MIPRIICAGKKSIDFFTANQLTSTQVHMKGYRNHDYDTDDDDWLVAHFSLNGQRSHARNQTLCRYPGPPKAGLFFSKM